MVRAGPVPPVGGDPQGDGTAGRAYSQGISGTASAFLCWHRKVSCRPVPWPPVPTFVAQSDYAPRGDLAGSAHDRPGPRSGALVFSGGSEREVQCRLDVQPGRRERGYGRVVGADEQLDLGASE